MSMNLKAVLFAAVITAACSQEKPSGDNASARNEDRDTAAAHDMSKMPAASDTAAMGGMDHSTMPAAQPGGAPANSPMPGMDHSQMANQGAQRSTMPGMDHSQMGATNSRRPAMTGMNHSATPSRGAAPQPMAGMDHSRMSMPSQQSGSKQPAAGMQNHDMPSGTKGHPPETESHAGMIMPAPGMTAQPAPADPHAGMVMAPVAQPAPDDVAMEKLRALVAELVRDPEIQALIQADPTLSALWQDPGVRQYLLKRP